jgi:hypothetical protein
LSTNENSGLKKDPAATNAFGSSFEVILYPNGENSFSITAQKLLSHWDSETNKMRWFLASSILIAYK